MHVSCYLLVIQQREENSLLLFFRKRIQGNGSPIWKYLFQLTPHAQSVVLITLFVIGILDVERMRNMMFVLFFVVYTAYYEVYRRTTIVLLTFVQLYILAQYAVSLFYPFFLVEPYDAGIITKLYQLDIFPTKLDNNDLAKDPYGLKPGASMYWRVLPVTSNLVLLFSVYVLRKINDMLNNEDSRLDAMKLMAEADEKVRQSNQKIVYYMNRIGTWVKTFSILAVVVLMLVSHSIIETDLMSWIFFVLNFINMAALIRGDSSKSSVARSLLISNIIKAYALAVLLLTFCFVTIIGPERPNDPKSIDQGFKRWSPWLYARLDVIGLRPGVLKYKDTTKMTEKEKADILARTINWRLFIVVIFFLGSVYLSSHFATQLTAAEEEEAFGENDYKRLFEYVDVDSSLALDKRHKGAAQLANDSDEYGSDESS